MCVSGILYVICTLNLKMVRIMTDLTFTESISYLDWHGDVGPTPAASTIYFQ